MKRTRKSIRLLAGVAIGMWGVAVIARGEEAPIPQEWDYAAAMKQVAVASHARPGVVIHIGDSITYANPYGGWARYGKGHTADDDAALKWMHTGANDDTDGWHLAAVDLPGGRSNTACGGIRADEMLAGGKSNMPPLKELLDQYRPQVAVVMLGTNDASAGRKLEAYRKDMETIVSLMLDRGIIPIVSTIPPHVHARALATRYNEALRQLARDRKLPLIDYEQEILKRRPDDWDGTLLNKGDVHPTATLGGADQSSEPTAEHLRNSGYLLRGWLSVKKIEEVKRSVLGDAQSAVPAPLPAVPPPAPHAADDGLRLPVTRDTWLSNVGPEGEGNNGGASQLKLKSNQEMSLIDIDPIPLKGHVIASATLHVHLSGGEVLRRVTVGSFAAAWTEGTATGYASQPGSSTFNHRQHPDVPWAYPGSDLTAVMLGSGGTIWGMAEASPPDAEHWQAIAVEPDIISARVAGISEGFILFDDTGSEWTRNGERFTPRHMPNRFIHSRESGAGTAPYLTVRLGEADDRPPAAPTGLMNDCSDLSAGEARVSWITPFDEGPAGTIGFQMDVDGKPVPRYLIPKASPPRGRVATVLRDLGIGAGQTVNVAIRAVDGAGNVGPAATMAVPTSAQVEAPLPGRSPEPFSGNAPLPKLGSAEFAVIDALDKMEPVSGRMIPSQPDGYLHANHLWDAGTKQVRLHAGKNEFVSFQLVVRGAVHGLLPTLAFEGEGAARPQPTFYRFRYVPSRAGAMPDPLVPLGDGLNVPSSDDRIEGQQTVGVLFCEIYVPHEASAGEQHGTLTLTVDEQKLALNVSLTVWDFTLPDFLSFLPEMNCYGLPGNERGYYRLAHLNRTVLNRVPYSQNGSTAAGCAPQWEGRKLDFARWDERFGPYFDGSAFADLPRKGVPIECFYLPLNDSWPSPMEGNYNESYWADQAFPATYRESFVSASKQLAEHCNARKWNQTIFQCFFNGKNNFKERGWSHGSSPWLLDEPSNFQDYWALRWYGQAFHEGADPVAGDARMMFRCDVSRPQWQRDALDGLLNYNVVGGDAFMRYRRLVLDRKREQGQIVIPYGGTNDLHQSNMQPVGWCLDAWTLGGDGVLPWQTIGNDDSWRKADALSLFYPGKPAGQEDPVPSVRLKAYLRGEQDVEYLVMLAQVERHSQIQLGRQVRQAISLQGVKKGTGFAGEDAGVIDFDALRPQDAWRLRVRIGELLSAAKPPARRQIVELGRSVHPPGGDAPSAN